MAASGRSRASTRRSSPASAAGRRDRAGAARPRGGPALRRPHRARAAPGAAPSRSRLVWGWARRDRQTVAVDALTASSRPTRSRSPRRARPTTAASRSWGAARALPRRHRLADAGGQRLGLARGHAGAAQGAGLARLPLAGRELRERLRLEGRHRRPRPAAAAQEPGLEGHRVQRRRHRRVHGARAASSAPSPTSRSTPGLGGAEAAAEEVEYAERRRHDAHGPAARRERPRRALRREAGGASATRCTATGSSATCRSRST